VKGRFLMVSIGLWVASFMGLLLVYGLNTWLATIMGEAGYSIHAGTGCCSSSTSARSSDCSSPAASPTLAATSRPVLRWFGLAAVFLALLSIRIENSILGILLSGMM
jgi:hypothetical protein